jgi:mRNA interferase RelE/StbE
MASYEIVFRKSVAKDLRGFPKDDVTRILERIRSLADDPRPPGCEKLSGLERYRLRQAYRIVCEIGDGDSPLSGVVGHPRDVYRRR